MGKGLMMVKVMMCLGMVTLIAQAGVTFETLDEVLVTDMSANGRILVGNTADTYETFRWTKSGGIVTLGRPTYPTLGGASGSPDISDDGTRISATILSDDEAYSTQGIWTQGQGWQELPMPADCNPLGTSKSSSWGLSGDGNTLVGLYWRGGMMDGGAHASKWTPSTGTVDLGSSGGNSRANDANYDGSVIVGWDEAPSGVWQPTVWQDGVMTHLHSSEAFCSADSVNPDGTIIGGVSYDDHTEYRGATLWRWDGENWNDTVLGVLPGTSSESGHASVFDMSADGSVIVGYNQYNYSSAEGFIWTEDYGMLSVTDFLRELGIGVDPYFNLQSITCVSDDGMTIAGIGQYLAYPFNYSSFVITIPEPASLLLLGFGTLLAVRRR